MRTKNLILVIAVVLVLVIAYYAIIGVTAKSPDVNDPGDDPTGGDRLPTAYGVIHVNLMVDNAVDRYTGEVQDSYCTVSDFISFDEGAVYQIEKLDILGLWSDDMTAWITVQITGPGQFLVSWESDHEKFSLSEWGHWHKDFTSGRMYFWDKGSYSMTINGYADGPSGKYQVGSKTVAISVGV
jgi:hypothetical protein